MTREGLDRAHGFRLELLQRVSPNASLVALQGGAADFTVSDWLWAARQRQNGRPYHYYPYSTAVGELLVAPGSRIERLEDLRGARLGVAGGAEDKSWLLFQTYARQHRGFDLAAETTTNYGAPPLLNGLADTGQLDAVLTYWHYAARLKAAGYEPLMSLREVLAELGIETEVPMLGWVFSEQLAAGQPQLVEAFLKASYAAKARLRDSDEAWEIVRPLMKASDEDVFLALRDAYRQGVPGPFGPEQISAISRVASLVGRQASDRKDAPDLPRDVFWLAAEPMRSP